MVHSISVQSLLNQLLTDAISDHPLYGGGARELKVFLVKVPCLTLLQIQNLDDFFKRILTEVSNNFTLSINGSMLDTSILKVVEDLFNPATLLISPIVEVQSFTSGYDTHAPPNIQTRISAWHICVVQSSNARLDNIIDRVFQSVK